VRFSQDYYQPFANRFAKAIREVHPEALIFVESTFEKDFLQWGPDDAERIVYAPHWYDPLTLVFKKFNPWMAYDHWRGKTVWLPWAIRRSFASQLRTKPATASAMCQFILERWAYPSTSTEGGPTEPATFPFRSGLWTDAYEQLRTT